MKKTLFVIILGISVSSCTSNEKYPSREDIKAAFNTVLDSAIRTTYFNEVHYDINGNFNFEYSDSLITNSLSCFDTIISKEDISFIIDQYNLLKGKNIEPYISSEKYFVKQGSKYYPEDSIDYQFYLSPPLFTLNRQYFVTYCIGTAIRPNSFIDGFYFLFINLDNKWYYHSAIKSDFTTPKNISSKQTHSYIPR